MSIRLTKLNIFPNLWLDRYGDIQMGRRYEDAHLSSIVGEIKRYLADIEPDREIILSDIVKYFHTHTYLSPNLTEIVYALLSLAITGKAEVNVEITSRPGLTTIVFQTAP